MSSHLSRSLPTGLVSWNFLSCNIFGILELAIRTTRPAHYSFLNLIHVPGALPVQTPGYIFHIIHPVHLNDLHILVIPKISQFCISLVINYYIFLIRSIFRALICVMCIKDQQNALISTDVFVL
jgi:hypothetical protein